MTSRCSDWWSRRLEWLPKLALSAMLTALAAGCGTAVVVSVADEGPGAGAAPPSPASTPQRAAGAPTSQTRPLASSGVQGPVPDFAPMAGIVTHVQLADMEPALPGILTLLLGARHVVERYSGPDPGVLDGTVPAGRSDERMLWIRDYQPLWVRRSDGSLKAIRYLSDNPNRAQYLPAIAAVGTAPGPSQRFLRLPGRGPGGRWVHTEVLPLLHDNGNLVTTGTLTFVTDLLLEENTQAVRNPAIRRAGYRPRSGPQVLRMFARAIERPVSDIVVLPQMPAENTGHVDTFVLALDPRTVLIPAILPEAVLPELLSKGAEGTAADARRFLDERASQLEALGLAVLRLPMLAPIAVHGEHGTPPDMVVLSPANALLVPVVGMRIVLLPRFDFADFPEPFQRTDAAYRRQWEDLFRAHRWTPVTVEATDLAINQGLLRCASYPIPR